MQILRIRAYIHINSQFIGLSWNCTNKEPTVVVWLAAWGAVTFQLVFTVSASAVGNSMWYSINIIFNLYYSFIILY